MNRFVLFCTVLFAFLAEANENKVCQACHPAIYAEYYQSSHRNASVYNNPIHKAMWEKYPKDEKGYTCAKCHSPSDLEALKNGVLKQNDTQMHEPISCIYCHTIQDVKEEENSNTNISSGKTREFYTAQSGKEGSVSFEKQSSLFGLSTSTKNSPFHKINYDNKNYYNGNVCMGCHSHTNNAHGIDITMLDAKIDEKDKNSCVSCHMPQVLGSKTTFDEGKTHAFHGMAGIHMERKKMAEYIDFKLSKNSNDFSISIINKSNHALFGQAYRQGVLKAEIKRGKKTIELEPFIFERKFAKDGKEVSPWEATEVSKDTLVYAKRDVIFNVALQSGDILTLTLGVKRISEEGAKELELKDSSEFTQFRVLKTQNFNF